MHRMVVVCFMLLPIAVWPAVAQKSSGYHLLHRYRLGGDGFWDYLRLDPTTRRLYVSHGTRVIVVDADQGTVVGEIANTNGVHGIALAPELGRGFTSNGRDTSVTVFDLKTLQVHGVLKVTGANPDAILYDSTTKRVFTFNARGANATAIDAARDSVVGTIPLRGKPEFAVADGGGYLYVNLEDTSELLKLDSRRLTVQSRWPLAPCEEPTGLAFDAEHERLFVGCSNKQMAVVDARSGKVLTTLPIGDGVDATRFDPETGFVFSSNGEGTLTVIHEDDPDHFRVVDTVKTQRGARTMELDPKTHDVYLATAEFGPEPPATRENPHPRPTIVPGSFVVLVYGR